jgi:hypothetical protein
MLINAATPARRRILRLIDEMLDAVSKRPNGPSE